MVECVNGRIASLVLEINVYSHRALEQLLRGFNTAYNGQLQRVLEGKTSNQVVVDHLKATPDLANPAPHGRTGPCDTTKIRLIADTAEKVSQPDTVHILRVRHAASDTEWRQPFPQHKVEHGPEPR